MKYYRYKVTMNTGFVYEYIMGDWLKEDVYDFGKVEIIEEITEQQFTEYEDIQDELYAMWLKQLPRDFFGDDSNE